MLARHALVLLLCPLAAADTLKVPGEFETIQAAIDAAEDGDTIVVAKGSYPGPVQMTSRTGLRLIGKGHPVLDATGSLQGVVVDECTDVEVRGFVVQGAQDAGVFLGDCVGVRLRKCEVIGSAIGVEALGNSSLVIERNEIHDQTDTGIHANGIAAADEDTRLTKNHVYDTGLAGIRVEGGNFRVERNRLEAPGADGIVVDSGALDCTVSRNRVEGATVQGIVVTATSEHLVERNRLTDCDVGVFISLVGAAATSRNRILGGSVGMHFGADGGTGDRDRVTGATQRGFEIEGDDCVVERARALQCGFGFRVSGTDATLEKCRALQSEDDGFFIGPNGNHSFTKCRAIASDEVGFRVTSDGNEFTSCTAKGNGTLDLEDTGTPGSNTYTKCKFGLTSP
jgi:nitrous oxidase accessory protein NosD